MLGRGLILWFQERSLLRQKESSASTRPELITEVSDDETSRTSQILVGLQRD